MHTPNSIKLCRFLIMPTILAACSIAHADVVGDLPNDGDLLNKVSEMNTVELKELLGLYIRLDRKDLQKAVATEVAKRDPNDEYANAVLEGRDVSILPKTESESEDRTFHQIENLRKQGRNKEIIKLLEGIKPNFSGAAFPYAPELAFAYYDGGNQAKARAIFEEIKRNSAYEKADRVKATEMVGEINRVADIEKGDALLKERQPKKALLHAEELERRYSSHPDVLALKVRAFTAMHRPAEARKILGQLRERTQKPQGIFEYSTEEADLLASEKRFEDAESIYQAILASRSSDQAMKKQAREGLVELEKTRRVEAAYDAIIARNAKIARSLLENLKAEFLNDPDVAILEGEVLLLENNPTAALATLEDARTRFYQNSPPFPAEPQVASALYQLNELEASAEAFSGIVNDDFFESRTRSEAGVSLKAIRKELGSMAYVGQEASTEAEGEVFRSSGFYRTAFHDDRRFWVWSHMDLIRASRETLLLEKDSERFDAGVSIEQRFSSFVSSAISLGGGTDAFIANGSLQILGQRSGKVAISGFLNRRSNDSVTLEALNGREHRVEVGFEKQLTPKLFLDGYVYGRKLHIENDDFGSGYGGEISLERTLIDMDRKRPALKVGYLGEVHLFDSGTISSSTVTSAIGTGASGEDRADFLLFLVEEEINLHGPKVVIEGRLSDRFAYLVTGAAQYDFYDRDVQFRVGTGASFDVNEKVSITGGVDFYSSGQTGSSDAGVYLANIGLSVLF